MVTLEDHIEDRERPGAISFKNEQHTDLSSAEDDKPNRRDYVDQR